MFRKFWRTSKPIALIASIAALATACQGAGSFGSNALIGECKGWFEEYKADHSPSGKVFAVDSRTNGQYSCHWRGDQQSAIRACENYLKGRDLIWSCHAYAQKLPGGELLIGNDTVPENEFARRWNEARRQQAAKLLAAAELQRKTQEALQKSLTQAAPTTLPAKPAATLKDTPPRIYQQSESTIEPDRSNGSEASAT